MIKVFIMSVSEMNVDVLQCNMKRDMGRALFLVYNNNTMTPNIAHENVTYPRIFLNVP